MYLTDATAILPITLRERIPTEAIEATVRQIVDNFRPQQIILFGSYASGVGIHPLSDVDLLVVMDTSLKEMEQAVRICQTIEYHFALDLIVRTPATLKQRLELGDPFVREIVDKGIILYERARDEGI